MMAMRRQSASASSMLCVVSRIVLPLRLYSRMISHSSSRVCGSSPVLGSSRKDRKSTRLNSSHLVISYAVFCLKKKKLIRHPSIEHRAARAGEDVYRTRALATQSRPSQGFKPPLTAITCTHYTSRRYVGDYSSS